ncbi:MAG: ribosome biogenesis GTP-binding protein YihA/YsxC [Clostridia bacterium]
MEINKAEYITSAAKYEQCIVSDLAQIAVVGKSNVGKSSFINYICSANKLARTSKQPGRTRLINYFLMNGTYEFILTDLPGYGYAEVSHAQLDNWASLIETYLDKDSSLAHVFFLVDSRHEPTADDITMYNYLFKCGIPYTVIATKIDKINKSERGKKLQNIANTLRIGTGNIIPVSVVEKIGKDIVLEKIEQVLTNLSTIEEDTEDSSEYIDLENEQNIE